MCVCECACVYERKHVCVCVREHCVHVSVCVPVYVCERVCMWGVEGVCVCKLLFIALRENSHTRFPGKGRSEKKENHNTNSGTSKVWLKGTVCL